VIEASDVTIDGRGKRIEGGNGHDGLYGIYVYGVRSNIQVRNLSIRDKTYGIHFLNVKGGRIDSVQVSNNWHGVFLSNSEGITITGVNADGNSRNGIMLQTSCTGNNIIANTANNNRDPNDPDNLAKGYGIILDTSCDNNQIAENIVTGNSQVGIYVHSSAGNTLQGNILKSNRYGIHSDWGSHHNLYTNNIASGNNWGIVFDPDTNNNTVTLNTAEDNGNSGIFFWKSSANTIDRNTVRGNDVHGIFLRDGGSGNIVSENTAKGSDYGIELETTNNNVVKDNIVTNNRKVGVFVYDSDNNMIEDNAISNNAETGILLDYHSNQNTITGNTINESQIGLIFNRNSNKNTVTRNNITGNTLQGIYLRSSRYQKIYDNFLKNRANVLLEGKKSINTWSVARMPGPNIVDGDYIGGNYWAQPNGQGFSQIKADADGDGIIESHYRLGKGYIPKNFDNHPLK
jgi:parallel beta-helix repeat protein